MEHRGPLPIADRYPRYCNRDPADDAPSLLVLAVHGEANDQLRKVARQEAHTERDNRNEPGR